MPTKFSYYPPYGSALPGLQYNYADDRDTSKYRFGFNTQERDDEIAGEGNSYTAEFWQFNSRLGRRFNIDPVIKYFESGFGCFTNNPILFVDIKGNDTGDVVIAFGGADIENNGNIGTAIDIITGLSTTLKSEGGSAQAFHTNFWGTKLNNKETMDAVTESAYKFIKENLNIGPNKEKVSGGKVFIYGYSAGGVLANHLTKRLENDNIKVNLLITVDAAWGADSDEIDRSISKNVAINWNLYQTTPSFVGSHGNTNTAIDTTKTKVVNTDMTGGSSSHSNLDEKSKDDAINVFKLGLKL